ncbi:sel1 repeat family protein [Psychrobacter frigidicola]|uniref:Sel1 repeat family protein n=1 Tax=Psychrobacter frigidicola TaxID=45611 RepID=A0A5C7A345_9GAMM|nr:SEL1-like repeat protein [Psychrobacter frigidicola]TXD98027.1 sel1 repeat family protein [Psychrobacter frigidicola]
MKKRLTTFLVTGIMLTGCTKAIDTQMNSIHNKVPTVKSAVEKEFADLTVQANQGDTRSQYNLGMMYLFSHGIRQNTVIAKKYFIKACDNGYQLGCKNTNVTD